MLLKLVFVLKELTRFLFPGPLNFGACICKLGIRNSGAGVKS